MTTSASSTRRRAIALSSSFLRFSTTDFLFRLSDTKFSLNPSFNGGHWRRPSPLGGSTLTTVAPLSESSMDAKGPRRLDYADLVQRKGLGRHTFSDRKRPATALSNDKACRIR